MAYAFLGGLTSAVYNEVLQFFLIVLGIVPLVIVGLKNVGGWDGLQTALGPQLTHAWGSMDSETSNPMGVAFWQMALGLGFVLSFGYWCTDFLVVQRAMIARNMSSAQRTPLIAAFPKMLLPFVVIVPGLIALALQKSGGAYHLPMKADGRTDFDMTLPSLLNHYYPSGMLGVGLTALIASFMSGMAGNVTAFNSVWTYDIYQAHIRKNAPDAHYLRVGKITTVLGVIFSIATAYLAREFNNIMDLLQLIFGFVNAPLFATFLLGMFWKRATANGAFWGLVAGTVGASVMHGVTTAEGKGGWLVSTPWHTFASGMGHAFSIAIAAWTTCFVVTVAVSYATKPRPESELRGLVYELTPRPSVAEEPLWKHPVFLGLLALGATVVLNWVFG
jgi:SSS family solute:Na+ symporter